LNVNLDESLWGSAEIKEWVSGLDIIIFDADLKRKFNTIKSARRRLKSLYQIINSCRLEQTSKINGKLKVKTWEIIGIYR
jgi:hypothetical protein